MSYYREMVQDMDDSQKLELVSVIIDSMKQRTPVSTEQMLEGYPYKRFTRAELNAMLDKAEANFEAGRGIPHEEVMREMDEEIERWEQETLDESRLPQQKLEMAEMI